MSLSKEHSEKFEVLLAQLKGDWTRYKPVTGWLAFDSSALVRAFDFLIKGVSDFVNLAKTIDVPGVDKKDIVMWCANQLFDFVVLPLLPTLLRPFGSTLKLVFSAMLNSLIEHLVSKL